MDLTSYLFHLAQCYVNNPCELGGYFVPPKYDCYQLSNSPNDAICTCPNGEARRNARCRKKSVLKFEVFIENIQVFATASIADAMEYVMNELYLQIHSIFVDVTMVQGVMRFLDHVQVLLHLQQPQQQRRRRQPPPL